MKSRALIILAFLLLFAPILVGAQGLPWVYCGDLPSCNPGWGESVSPLIQRLADLLPVYARVLGVLFVMIAGSYMVISAGNEERVSTGKTTLIWVFSGVLVTTFAPTIVGFIVDEILGKVAGPDLVQSTAFTVMTTIRDLLYVALLIIALTSGGRMVLANGEEDAITKGRQALTFAVIGSLVIYFAERLILAVATI